MVFGNFIVVVSLQPTSFMRIWGVEVKLQVSLTSELSGWIHHSGRVTSLSWIKSSALIVSAAPRPSPLMRFEVLITLSTKSDVV